MQQSANQEPMASDTSVDTHHDVLSVSQKQNHGLLSHLQTGVPNPLELLLNANSPPKSLLNNVAVTPANTRPVPKATPEAPLGKVMIDNDRPLSQCLLWDIMDDYYANLGINAWQAGVPMFITNSAYIAESYAEIILAFVEDYYDHLDLDEPLYMVEMATGTGRFAHLLLQELERKQACFEKLQKVRLKYIMTDFTDKNPTFWQLHPKLQPYIKKGMVDFAVFNPVEQDSLELRVSKETIAAGTLKNPLLAVGNYFFDTIKHDIFRVESKVLKEGRVTIHRNMEGLAPDAKLEIGQVETEYTYRELYNTNYYEDAGFNNILNHYRHNIKNGSIIFPIGALNVIRNLETLSNNQLVLISSDKSFTCCDEMIRYYKHDYAIHGSFSFMVNYDAIGHLFKQSGGHYLHTTGKNLSLQTVCCIELEHAADCRFERLQYVFKEKIDRSNAINSVCAIMPGKEADNPVGKLTVMLSQLRLNLADPQMFAVYGQSLVDIAAHGLKSQQDDLLALMAEAWEKFYYYPGCTNLPFWLGQLYYMMGHYEQSLSCLDKAIELFGQHEVLYFLKGHNYTKMQKWQDAHNEYTRAVQMRENFPEAWECLREADSHLK